MTEQRAATAEDAVTAWRRGNRIMAVSALALSCGSRAGLRELCLSEDEFQHLLADAGDQQDTIDADGAYPDW